jgi:hypothetical protein
VACPTSCRGDHTGDDPAHDDPAHDDPAHDGAASGGNLHRCSNDDHASDDETAAHDDDR